MNLQVKKRKDGTVELLEDGILLALLTRKQAESLVLVLLAATK